MWMGRILKHLTFFFFAINEIPKSCGVKLYHFTKVLIREQLEVIKTHLHIGYIPRQVIMNHTPYSLMSEMN